MSRPSSGDVCGCRRSTRAMVRAGGAERQAINAPMQGTAADLIKLAMIAVQQALDEQGKKTKIVMQVHDELVFEVPDEELDWVKSEVPTLMAGVAALKVPLLAEVGVGANWDEDIAHRLRRRPAALTGAGARRCSSTSAAAPSTPAGELQLGFSRSSRAPRAGSRRRPGAHAVHPHRAAVRAARASAAARDQPAHPVPPASCASSPCWRSTTVLPARIKAFREAPGRGGHRRVAALAADHVGACYRSRPMSTRCSQRCIRRCCRNRWPTAAWCASPRACCRAYRCATARWRCTTWSICRWSGSTSATSGRSLSQACRQAAWASPRRGHRARSSRHSPWRTAGSAWRWSWLHREEGRPTPRSACWRWSTVPCPSALRLAGQPDSVAVRAITRAMRGRSTMARRRSPGRAQSSIIDRWTPARCAASWRSPRRWQPHEGRQSGWAWRGRHSTQTLNRLEASSARRSSPARAARAAHRAGTGRPRRPARQPGVWRHGWPGAPARWGRSEGGEAGHRLRLACAVPGAAERAAASFRVEHRSSAVRFPCAR